jgi:SSS family solute:Na+ symporter
MTLALPDIVVIVLYFVLMLFFGYITRRTKTFAEFAIGKHSVPAMMVFASMAATIIGPGFSIGFTAKGWATGYFFYYLILAYAIQVIVVGLYLAPKLSQYRDCNSLGDVMRKKYGVIAQFLTGIISVGLCIGFTAVMGKIGGSTLHAVTGWSLEACLILVTGVTAFITFSGGVRATIATEGLQFSLKSIAVSILLLMAIAKAPDSLSIIAMRADELARQGFDGMNGWQIFGVVLSFMVGEALIPPYANRALAAKSGAASKAGFVAAGLFCVAWFGIVILLGVVAHSLLPAGTSGDDVFIKVAQEVLPVGFLGLLLAAVVAIVMASQESVLNSAAVAFVRDIVGVMYSPSERMTLFLAKASTLVFAAAAIYATQFAPSIIDGLLVLYSIWAPTILLPLVLGLYIQATKPAAGYLSILVGGGSSIAWQTILHEPYQVPAIFVGLSAAAFAYLIGHVISFKPLELKNGDAL